MFQTIGKTTSMVVAGTFFAVLAYQRDALMLSFFLGAIFNGILSKVLKKVVNQERPVRGGPRQEEGQEEGQVLLLDEEDLSPSDNGMPSSHAMSLGFICTFTALQLPYTTIPLLLYVFISLWYRVETKLHTLDQVLVGLVLGTLDSFLWRSLCFGTNPFFNNHINVMEWVTSNLLNEQGVMPIYALTVPAIVGALVVGSVERRIQRFLQNRRNAKQE
jgi:membrane-associated phospholipid phosphatase